MSDEKPVKDEKELKDEELDKVSGGVGGGAKTDVNPVGHNSPGRLIHE